MNRKSVLAVCTLLQGCDASNVITVEQWQVASDTCASYGGVDIIDRNFGEYKAYILCKSGALFKKEVPPTRFVPG